jgi:hypothetical protein
MPEYFEQKHPQSEAKLNTAADYEDLKCCQSDFEVLKCYLMLINQF